MNAAGADSAMPPFPCRRCDAGASESVSALTRELREDWCADHFCPDCGTCDCLFLDCLPRSAERAEEPPGALQKGP